MRRTTIIRRDRINLSNGNGNGHTTSNSSTTTTNNKMNCLEVLPSDNNNNSSSYSKRSMSAGSSQSQSQSQSQSSQHEKATTSQSLVYSSPGRSRQRNDNNNNNGKKTQQQQQQQQQQQEKVPHVNPIIQWGKQNQNDNKSISDKLLAACSMNNAGAANSAAVTTTTTTTTIDNRNEMKTSRERAVIMGNNNNNNSSSSSSNDNRKKKGPLMMASSSSSSMNVTSSRTATATMLKNLEENQGKRESIINSISSDNINLNSQDFVESIIHEEPEIIYESVSSTSKGNKDRLNNIQQASSSSIDREFDRADAAIFLKNLRETEKKGLPLNNVTFKSTVKNLKEKYIDTLKKDTSNNNNNSNKNNNNNDDDDINTPRNEILNDLKSYLDSIKTRVDENGDPVVNIPNNFDEVTNLMSRNDLVADESNNSNTDDNNNKGGETWHKSLLKEGITHETEKGPFKNYKNFLDMDQTKQEKFELGLAKIKQFDAKLGDIMKIGMEKEKELQQKNEELKKVLSDYISNQSWANIPRKALFKEYRSKNKKNDNMDDMDDIDDIDDISMTSHGGISSRPSSRASDTTSVAESQRAFVTDHTPRGFSKKNNKKKKRSSKKGTFEVISDVSSEVSSSCYSTTTSRMSENLNEMEKLKRKKRKKQKNAMIRDHINDNIERLRLGGHLTVDEEARFKELVKDTWSSNKEEENNNNNNNNSNSIPPMEAHAEVWEDMTRYAATEDEVNRLDVIDERLKQIGEENKTNSMLVFKNNDYSKDDANFRPSSPSFFMDKIQEVATTTNAITSDNKKSTITSIKDLPSAPTEDYLSKIREKREENEKLKAIDRMLNVLKVTPVHITVKRNENDDIILPSEISQIPPPGSAKSEKRNNIKDEKNQIDIPGDSDIDFNKAAAIIDEKSGQNPTKFRLISREELDTVIQASKKSIEEQGSEKLQLAEREDINQLLHNLRGISTPATTRRGEGEGITSQNSVSSFFHTSDFGVNNNNIDINNNGNSASFMTTIPSSMTAGNPQGDDDDEEEEEEKATTLNNNIGTYNNINLDNVTTDETIAAAEVKATAVTRMDSLLENNISSQPLDNNTFINYDTAFEEYDVQRRSKIVQGTMDVNDRLQKALELATRYNPPNLEYQNVTSTDTGTGTIEIKNSQQDLPIPTIDDNIKVTYDWRSKMGLNTKKEFEMEINDNEINNNNNNNNNNDNDDKGEIYDNEDDQKFTLLLEEWKKKEENFGKGQGMLSSFLKDDDDQLDLDLVGMNNDGFYEIDDDDKYNNNTGIKNNDVLYDDDDDDVFNKEDERKGKVNDYFNTDNTKEITTNKYNNDTIESILLEKKKKITEEEEIPFINSTSISMPANPGMIIEEIPTTTTNNNEFQEKILTVSKTKPAKKEKLII